MDELRKQADEKVQKHLLWLEKNEPENLPPLAVRSVLSELHVHQIELEMQNEELRRTQMELEISRARYINLYDFAPIGYILISEKGLILESNLAALTLFGVENKGRLINRPLSQYIHVEDRNILFQHFRQLQAADTPQVCELRICRKNSVPFWVNLKSILDAGANAQSNIRSAIIDISARKEAELALGVMNADLEKRVKERTEEVSSLALSIAFAEERERHLIALELHDGLGQLLNVIRLKAESFSMSGLDEKSRALTNELDRLLLDAVRMVRSVTSRLSPPVLGTFGLIPALSWLAEDLEREYGLSVHLDVADSPVPIPEEISQILFRSARELLINVAKHSGLLEAWLGFAPGEGGNLLLSVKDLGSGLIDSNQKFLGASSYGLRSIRERIIQLGGDMRVDSAPGKGTLVMLELPFPSHFLHGKVLP